MPQTTVVERQYPLIATAIVTKANIGAGNEVLLKIPAGAYVMGVQAFTTVAFDGTTNTITLGDGATTFVSAQDVKTLGLETAAVANKYYPTGGTITVSLAQTGTATVGQAIALVEYIVPGKWNENQT